jgi:hypothetical protein
VLSLLSLFLLPPHAVYGINRFMDDRERITFLTANYLALQGLRFTPFWLFFALKPWFDLLPNRRPTFIHDYGELGILLFCGVWIWLAGRYYRGHFGSVQKKPTNHPVWNSLLIAGFIVAFFVASWADEKNPPVSFLALFWACFLGAQAMASGGSNVRRLYYGIASASLLAVSLLPLAGRIPASHIFATADPFGNVLLGIELVTLGLLDHSLLVRMFAQPLRGLDG